MYMWILLVFVFSEFAFIAYNWFAYCPPLTSAKFAFSGVWFKEQFYLGNAGLALDQPTLGKFFLWTSILSCLACTVVLLLHAAVSIDHRTARRWVTASTALLITLVLIEFLAPTFLLVQYVVSMGLTINRFLGLCLCCGFWILLPSVVFWIRKADPALMKWMTSPLTWALACSLVAPTYYMGGMLHPSAWRYWDTIDTAFMLAWLALVAPILCVMWLGAKRKLHSMNHDT